MRQVTNKLIPDHYWVFNMGSDDLLFSRSLRSPNLVDLFTKYHSPCIVPIDTVVVHCISF